METSDLYVYLFFYNQAYDSKLNDTVTIITSPTGDQIVKSFGGPDYQALKFSPGSEFLVSQQPVYDLQSLAWVIGGLKNPSCSWVLGS